MKLIIVKEKVSDKEKFKIKCFENPEHNVDNLDENVASGSVNDEDVYKYNDLQEYTHQISNGKKSVSVLN